MMRLGGENQSTNPRLLWGVMAAVGIWGGLLALGAGLFGTDQQGEVHFAPNPVRGLIVLACVWFFLGGWFLLVKRRRA